MLHNNRIILKDGDGNLTDYSGKLSDIALSAQTLALSNTDTLYLASAFPFNHRYFEIESANDQACVATVSLWSGADWIDAVDQIDQTSVAGASFGQSGIISWVPDRDTNQWTAFPRSQFIPSLESTRIYDLFWARVRFSAAMKGTTSIRYIGHKFSSDADLALQYPDLVSSDMMTAFKSGKTSWMEQTVLAAEYIIQDLKERGVIISRGQILDWSVFQKASVHKTAAIIFSGMGKDWADHKKEAEKEYRASLQLKSYSVDENFNAALDAREQTQMSEFLTR